MIDDIFYLYLLGLFIDKNINLNSNIF
jgi:hypothetical protein